MRPTGLFAGLATLDIVHTVAREVGADEKVTALRQDVAAGGPAANAAVTFAALGGGATLITALGRHPLAAVSRDELESRGVRVVDTTPNATAPPAVSAVRVVQGSGERSVSSVNASGVDASPPQQIVGLVAGWDVVLLDGHHPALALATARAARAAGVPIVIDCGSWKPVLDRLLPLVDAAICSAAFSVPGAPAPLAALGGYGVDRVAVTHGGEPIEWVSGDASGTIPVPQVPVRDTMGAGDAFHGAAAWALARDEPWPRLLEFAARITAIRVQHPGPRAWLDELRLP